MPLKLLYSARAIKDVRDLPEEARERVRVAAEEIREDVSSGLRLQGSLAGLRLREADFGLLVYRVRRNQLEVITIIADPEGKRRCQWLTP